MVIPPVAAPPTGLLRVANPGTSSHLSGLARAGRAFLLAPRLYVVDSTLPPEAVARHHVLSVVEPSGPGGQCSATSPGSTARPRSTAGCLSATRTRRAVEPKPTAGEVRCCLDLVKDVERHCGS